MRIVRFIGAFTGSLGTLDTLLFKPMLRIEHGVPYRLLINELTGATTLERDEPKGASHDTINAGLVLSPPPDASQ